MLSLFRKTSHNILYHFHQLALSFSRSDMTKDILINDIKKGAFDSSRDPRPRDPMSGFFDTDFDQNYYFYFISKVQLDVYHFLMNKYII